MGVLSAFPHCQREVVSLTMSDLVVIRYGHLVLKGISVTFQISLLAMLGGVVFGLLAALLRLSKRKAISAPAATFIELGRNTPAFVSMMWFTFVLPQVVGIRIPAFWTAWMALALQTSGYLAEVFRAGIEAIEREQRLAARAVGMTYAQEMRRIVLPQALRVVIPDIMNQFVVVFKTSTLVSVVAVPDLMYHAHRLVSQLFKPTEIYTSVAAIYILSVTVLALLVRLIERRARRYLIR